MEEPEIDKEALAIQKQMQNIITESPVLLAEVVPQPSGTHVSMYFTLGYKDEIFEYLGIT